VAAVGVGAYVGNVWAQPTGARPTAPTGGAGSASAAAASPRTRVALINLSHVIRSYEKFKAYQLEIKDSIRPFQDKEGTIKQRAETLAKEAQAQTTSTQRREQIEKELKDLQRSHEDLKNDFQKVMGKKQEDQLVILYGDVYNVAARHAAAHNFDMVLHYNDGNTREERWAAQNVARKMQAGALVPLYYSAGMDISEDIIRTLNDMYKTNRAGPAAGGSPPAATPGR
jgi:Skp family chaperone for outer membrane proteins